KLKITFIFVTHDQEEALVMSDRIAVLNAGHIEQVGNSCTDIFERPRTEFVANFMGATNLFDGTISHRDGKAFVTMAGVSPFPLNAGEHGDGAIRFTVRPEKLLLTKSAPENRVSLPVTIEDEVYQGTSTSWIVRYLDRTLVVIEQNSKTADVMARFSRGDQAYLSWDPNHTVILETS